jgi:4-alpha-glucanotransferase
LDHSTATPDQGIESEYIDTWGRKHVPSEETRRLILAARGPATEAGPLDPTIVVHEDAESIALRVPAANAGSSMKLEIRWEGGDIEHHWFWMPQLREGNPGEKLIPLPKPLRMGYHELSIYSVTQPELTVLGQANFIVCPRRARTFEGRAAGVALSLYGVRSARDWGCGDITDLRAAIDVFARAGAAFVALNPLHAIANRQPYNTSPYLPQSSLYRNFIYIDVERTPGYVPEEWIAHEAAELRASEFVEYESVARLKLKALSDAFDRFMEYGAAPEFDAFIEAEGSALQDYAVYCALDEAMHNHDPQVWLWMDWPERYRDPRSPAVEEFAREIHGRVLFFKFLQWQLDVQLAQAQEHALARGMTIGLYHDLALATDRFGADLWANRGFYVAGRVGAPPDDFAPNGQDWGFPPPNREAHRANGYKLFAQSIRNSARHGGVLRIDHVMRFFRLYWMPDGVSAGDGAYVRDYADDLLGVVALESMRNGFFVVGEDLGTVSGDVRQRLAEAGLFSIRLLWFERHDDGGFRAPGEYPAQASVSTTTHDLPTLAGFFSGRDIEARKAAGLIDEASYQEQWSSRHREIERLNQALDTAGFHSDPLGFVMSTPCSLAVVNQEDLTGETDQQNLPASTWQYPNWRHKMKVAVEDMAGIEEDLRRRILHSRRAPVREEPRTQGMRDDT